MWMCKLKVYARRDADVVHKERERCNVIGANKQEIQVSE